MKSTFVLAMLFIGCGGDVDTDGADGSNTGLIVHENVDCADLTECLCRACGQTCELCGSNYDSSACQLCIDYAEGAGNCVEQIDACL